MCGVRVSDDIEIESRQPRTTILSRYIFGEILTPFLIALFVFTGVLFLAKSLKLVELVISKGVSVLDIAELFLLIVPQFLEIAIPMALLLGSILAFGRLSADSELVVMRSVGVNMRRLLVPVMVFAGICFSAGVILAFYVRPWANYQLALKTFEMAQVKASTGLVAGVFNDFGQLTLYSESIGESGAMSHVILADRRLPEKQRIFISQRGSLVSDPETRNITLQLYDGTIHEGAGVDYNVTFFDLNSIVLESSDFIGDSETRGGKKASEMVISELLAAIRHPSGVATESDNEEPGEKVLSRLARYGVEFHRRLVLPTLCFVVAILGMTLGVQPNRGGRSWGVSANIAAGILVTTLYYFLLAFATALGEQRAVAPWLVMWLPNLLFGALGLYLYRRVESEQWAAVSQALGDRFVGLFSRLQRLVGGGE